MKLIKAEDYFCFFALLEMILSDIGIPDIDQIRIADYFEVVFPFGHTRTTKKCRFSNDTWQLGAHINVDDINAFFDSNNIHCSCSYFPANHICELTFDDMLNNMLKADSYIITAYSYGSLNNDFKNRDIGHVGLLTKILPSFMVEMYDPGPKEDGYKMVDTSSLYDAMRCRNGGIYLFEKPSQDKYYHGY